MKEGGSATGGKLLTTQYAAYGQYVVDYIKRFKTDVGADLYAVSAQNEPAICTGYNSACYLPNELTPVIIGVADAIAASGLSTFLHWPDNIWWGGTWEDFSGVTRSANAVKVGNIMSWHYGDNTEAAERRQLGILQTEATGGVNKFRMWNTEFGGYFDDWAGLRNDETNQQTGDAWLMAQIMHLNMQYGFNAIVWWQLAEPPQQDAPSRHYGMLYNAKMGPRGAVMQNFARYIRPGAVRVGATSSDANVWSVAFKHAGDQTVTVLLLNNGSSATTATIAGTGLPTSFDAFQTSPTQNCVKIGSFAPGATINLPVKSITTLYNMPTVGIQTPQKGVAPAQSTRGLAAGRASTIAVDGSQMKATASRPSGLYLQSADKRAASKMAKVK
jgi:O-glycosyl hydrolase